MIEEFERESLEIRHWLTENWTEDFGLQSEATARDEAVVDQIGGLLGSTSDREEKVLFITQKLYEQLKTLANFLGKMGEPLPIAAAAASRSLKSSPSRTSTSEGAVAAAAGGAAAGGAVAAATVPPLSTKTRRRARVKGHKKTHEDSVGENPSSTQEAALGAEKAAKVNPNSILPPIHSKS